MGRKNNTAPLTEAQRQLAADNHALVYYAYKRLGPKYATLDGDDLYSALQEGLIKAARGYRPELGFAFSTYAFRWFRSVARVAYLNSRLIHVPLYQRESSRRNELYADAEAAMRREVEHHDDLDQIAVESHLPFEPATVSPEWRRVRAAIDALPPPQHELIEVFILADHPPTYSEFARRDGVSKERVRQRLAGALNALASRLGVESLTVGAIRKGA